MPDVSAHSTPLPRVGGTPGFTPERRFGESALHVRAFLPGASCGAYLWHLVAPSRLCRVGVCGLPLEHHLRVLRQHLVSSGRPAATRARSNERAGSHGSRPVGLDAFLRPRVNAVELRTPEIPFPSSPFPRPTARSWLSTHVPRAERPRRARTVLQCQPTLGTVTCLCPAPPLEGLTEVSHPPGLAAPASSVTAGAAPWVARGGTILPSTPFARWFPHDANAVAPPSTARTRSARPDALVTDP